MRIIAGTAGGRRLAAPPTGTRPTTDRVREALFSSLDAHVRGRGGDWGDVHVLDLFAGSGAVGLEALSRGAAHATLVERDRRCLDVLRANVAAVDPRAHVVSADAFEWSPADTAFDLVYVDPPYAVPDDDVSGLLARLGRSGAFADDALVVVERSRRSASPFPAEGFEPLHDRGYGDTRLWYGQAKPPGTARMQQEA
jgi:16S rRNA (guanine966-N2)-methyltransferase